MVAMPALSTPRFDRYVLRRETCTLFRLVSMVSPAAS